MILAGIDLMLHIFVNLWVGPKRILTFLRFLKFLALIVRVFKSHMQA